MSLIKKALVTGASEGIGRAMSLKLAQNGFEVTVVARNDVRLNELIKILPGVGHQKVVADLSTQEGVKRVTDLLEKTHFHLLMNNAGFGYLGKFESQDLKKVREMMTLNMDTLVSLSHSFMKTAEKGDSLINVSSTLSFLPMPMQTVYAATKAFVTSFTESLWYDAKKRGVHVINLCPGITATQFNARAGGEDRKLPQTLTQTPEEVVELVYRAMVDRKGPTIVSGWKNQVAANLPRFVSRNWVVKMMGKASQ